MAVITSRQRPIEERELSVEKWGDVLAIVSSSGLAFIGFSEAVRSRKLFDKEAEVIGVIYRKGNVYSWNLFRMGHQMRLVGKPLRIGGGSFKFAARGLLTAMTDEHLVAVCRKTVETTERRRQSDDVQ